MEKKKRIRRKKKLTRMIQRQVLIVAIILLLVATGLNIVLFYIQTSTLVSNSLDTQLSMYRTVVAELEQVPEFAVKVMETYRQIPDLIRQYPESEAYRACFKELSESEIYNQVMKRIGGFESGLFEMDVYMAMYDPQTSALVYIADPVTKSYDSEGNSYEKEIRDFEIGSWEWASEDEINTMLEGSRRAEALIGTMPIEGINDFSFFYSKEDDGEELIIGAVPILTEDGKTACLLMGDISPSINEAFTMIFSIIYFVVLTFVTLILVILVRLRVHTRIVRPINKIMNAAASYAHDKLNRESQGNYFDELGIHTRDELEELANVLQDMETDLSEFEADLTKATAETERIRTELNLARNIQEDMLPRIFPPFPEHKEFDIYAYMHPAKEVGGDFYDFFLVDDTHLGLVIADVSGKGVPAALFMMSAKIMIVNYASTGCSPAEILRKMNDQICKVNAQEMFVTVWIGIIDLCTGVMTAANAGHEYPVIRHRDGQYELYKDMHCFVVGGMEGVKYKEYNLTIEPGASLFVYTDGVTEATNEAGELFGTDRMLTALNQDPSASPERLINIVKEAIGGFVRYAPQFDDITMLALKYLGRCEDEQRVK